MTRDCDRQGATPSRAPSDFPRGRGEGQRKRRRLLEEDADDSSFSFGERDPTHFRAVRLSRARERDIWMIGRDICCAARFSETPSRVRRRGLRWSMRHSLEGAVLANDRERGVRPRSSWLREPSESRPNPAAKGPRWKGGSVTDIHYLGYSSKFLLLSLCRHKAPIHATCFTSSTLTPAPPSLSTSSWHYKGNRAISSLLKRNVAPNLVARNLPWYVRSNYVRRDNRLAMAFLHRLSDK